MTVSIPKNFLMEIISYRLGGIDDDTSGEALALKDLRDQINETFPDKPVIEPGLIVRVTRDAAITYEKRIIDTPAHIMVRLGKCGLEDDDGQGWTEFASQAYDDVSGAEIIREEAVESVTADGNRGWTITETLLASYDSGTWNRNPDEVV